MTVASWKRRALLLHFNSNDFFALSQAPAGVGHEMA